MGSRGQVLLATALTLPVLLGMVGFAIDMGRIYAAQARLQAAVDSAALAGSFRLFGNANPTGEAVQLAAEDYLSRNYPEAELAAGDGQDAISPPSDSEIQGVCVRAEVKVPMTFMSVLGVSAQTISASSCSGFNDLEVVVVIDNTASMHGQPITQVRRAAKKLVNMIMGGAGGAVKVGLVPFRGKVDVDGAEDGLPSGCRNADGSLNAMGPSSNCISAIPQVLPLSTDKGAIRSGINRLNAPRGDWASSGTVIAEGIKWGRKVLTSDPPYDQASPQGSVRKVMILLTDGDNEDGRCGGPFANPKPHSTYWRNAYHGMGVHDCSCENYGCLDQAMLEEAEKAKNDYGIEIFTIRYGDSDFIDRELMMTVASEPQTDHYLDAPTASDIEDQFAEIGRQLVRLL